MANFKSQHSLADMSQPAGQRTERQRRKRTTRKFGKGTTKQMTHANGSEQNKRQPRMLYIFDEPTTGLHFDDIAKLLAAFQRLIENGASILIIEHNLDVIRSADWVIDLGPEGGDRGGNIVAQGTPEQIAAAGNSYTGRYLKEYAANAAR